MKIVNVKVKFIRPQYENLSEWMEDENNVYWSSWCICR